LDTHPTAAELKGLVYGGISAARSRAVVAHILHGCKACSLELAPHLEELLGCSERPGLPASPPESYDEALNRAFAAVKRTYPRLSRVKTVERKKHEALALLASGGLQSLAEAPPNLQGLPMFEALLEWSWALRYDDPAQMVELAQAAALLADKLSSRTHGAKKVADLCCRAWVELSNAYRVADELDRAGEALERAAQHFRDGSQSDSLRSRLFTVLAAQLAARRFFDMACDTLDIVVEICRQQGDDHSAGRALILKGIFTGYEGKAEEGIQLMREGLSSVDERRDPSLVFSALQSQAWLLTDSGRFREARRAVWELRRRRLDPGGRVNELKLRWLEAHISAGMGELARAEQILRQVKEGFVEAGLRFKAALAGLELAAVWLRQGRFDETTALVLECTDVFESLKIEREAGVSVMLLQQAAQVRTLTLTLLEHAIRSLQNVERGPFGRL